MLNLSNRGNHVTVLPMGVSNFALCGSPKPLHFPISLSSIEYPGGERTACRASNHLVFNNKILLFYQLTHLLTKFKSL